MVFSREITNPVPVIKRYLEVGYLNGLPVELVSRCVGVSTTLNLSTRFLLTRKIIKLNNK